MTAMRNSQSRAGTGFLAYGRRLSTLWRIIAYRWYWLGSATQGLAQATQFLVIGWLVLEVTGSSAQLGLVVSIYGVPNVAFLLIAGVIADRFDRRYIMMFTQVVAGGLLAVLAFLTATDLVAVWHIYVAAAFLGASQSISVPARMSVIADLVEERSILDAIAMQNAAVHAGRIMGPPIAGIIIEVWGLHESLLVVAGCYIVSVACVAKIGPIRRAAPSIAKSVFRNFADGIIYIKKTPVILTSIVITCSFGGFGMSHMQVLPAMAKDTLGIGAADIGLLLLASGIGSFIGSFILPFIGRDQVYRSLLICLVLFAAFLTLFAWSNWFWVTWMFFLFVGVVSVGMVWPLATTIIQLESAPELRGRVMAVLSFTPGFHFLGAFPLALAAGVWGWEIAITGAAGASLFVTIWFALVRSGAPKLRSTAPEAA